MLEEELYQWVTYAPYLSSTTSSSQIESKIRHLLSQGVDINYRQGQYYRHDSSDSPYLVHQLVESNVMSLLDLFLSLGIDIEVKNQVSLVALMIYIKTPKHPFTISLVNQLCCKLVVMDMNTWQSHCCNKGL